MYHRPLGVRVGPFAMFYVLVVKVLFSQHGMTYHQRHYEDFQVLPPNGSIFFLSPFGSFSPLVT
jgi:hypothetical protein